MRFFIALEIPEENKSQIEKIQDGIKNLIPSARLTDHDKLHLTLAFIGEQPDILKDQLIEVLRNAAQGVSPFQITPAYIDGFPNIHHPHTLWIGVKGDIDKLLIIRERIKDELTGLNLLVDERRFTPHISIADVQKLSTKGEMEAHLQHLVESDLEPINVSSIKLFESIPEHGFHRHNTLAEVKLIS